MNSFPMTIDSEDQTSFDDLEKTNKQTNSRSVNEERCCCVFFLLLLFSWIILLDSKLIIRSNDRCNRKQKTNIEFCRALVLFMCACRFFKCNKLTFSPFFFSSSSSRNIESMKRIEECQYSMRCFLRMDSSHTNKILR